MSDGAQSSSMRRGGFVVLLLLFGGFGIYFGPGRGKSSSNANKNGSASVNANKVRKQPVRKRPTKPRSPVVNASQPEPVRGTPNTQPPTSRTDKRPAAPRISAVNKYAYTYILRLRYIHAVKSDGTMSKDTVSLEELVKKGQKAASAKQELHLRLRGDARAKWVAKVKQALEDQKVVFSLTNEF